ncbi:MAG: translesion error-prone DNA polymerase V autoproteolytic subunit [Ignavibacteria bacterium]
MKLEIIELDTTGTILLPYFENRITAGFPSPAMDYSEEKLDIKDYLIQHPNSTFFVRVNGDSMIGEGINDGDLLVVDKSISGFMGHIVIAEVNGEFTVKKIEMINGRLYLIAANDKFEPIEINETTEFMIWGVVTYSIHRTL